MTRTIRHNIGPDGDFPTLAEWASALPRDLIAEDARYVAQLGGQIPDPGGIVIASRSDATRSITICPRPGEGFRDLYDPLTDALAPAPELGAMIQSLTGDAIRIHAAQAHVEIHGLQMICENGAVTGETAGTVGVVLGDCMIDANSAHPAVTLTGPASRMTGCTLIQRGLGDGICLRDGARIANSLIFKPERPVATGSGVATGTGRGCEASSVAVFGFRQSFAKGLSKARHLVSDQVNLVPAATDLADPAWQRTGASVDPMNTVPGPFAIPMQRVGNNQNGFSRLEGPVLGRCEPGERFSASLAIAQPTSLTSALTLGSVRCTAELMIDWRTTPPTTHLSRPRGTLQAKAGGITALGGETWRLWLEVENTGADPQDIRLGLHISRGTENVGLLLGMYAGMAMAGPGHLGNGFVPSGTALGPDCIEGVDPARALHSVDETAPDLRPLPGGPLEDLFAPPGAAFTHSPT